MGGIYNKFQEDGIVIDQKRRVYGGFVDIVQPVFTKSILGWEKAVFNVACRLEYVDWNVGKFEETNQNIGEDLWSIVPVTM